jgi:hypothetical protein
MACATGPKLTAEERAALERGCEADVAASCYDLSEAYFFARGVRADYRRSSDLAQKSCNLGHAPACTFHGGRLLMGEGVEAQPEQARAQYLRGCEGGDQRGCYNHGLCLRNGIGGPIDTKGANAFFERSCDSEWAGSCNNLAVSYFDGTGGHEIDLDRAASLFDRSCGLGDEGGCENARGVRLLIERVASGQEYGPAWSTPSASSRNEGPAWSTNIGSLTVGVGESRVTLTDVRASCNAISLVAALAASTGPLQECLDGSLPVRVFVDFEAGRIASSRTNPSDRSGPCVMGAIENGYLEDLTCSLQATFNPSNPAY